MTAFLSSSSVKSTTGSDLMDFVSFVAVAILNLKLNLIVARKCVNFVTPIMIA